MPNETQPPKWYGHFSYNQNTCPACGSNNVKEGGVSSTLVGWIGGPDKDPNHHMQECECRACSLRYSREWVVAHKNAWAAVYTKENRSRYAIAGYPSCCASLYFVQCRCGGWAENQQRGRTVSSQRGEDGVWVTTPPSIWGCSACGYSGAEQPIKEQVPPRTAWDRLDTEDIG